MPNIELLYMGKIEELNLSLLNVVNWCHVATHYISKGLYHFSVHSTYSATFLSQILPFGK